MVVANSKKVGFSMVIVNADEEMRHAYIRKENDDDDDDDDDGADVAPAAQ